MDLFDVIEVEITDPNSTRIMAVGLDKDNADAFVKMAVIRRGVENHIFRAVPAGTVKTDR